MFLNIKFVLFFYKTQKRPPRLLNEIVASNKSKDKFNVAYDLKDRLISPKNLVRKEWREQRQSAVRELIKKVYSYPSESHKKKHVQIV